ncbi:YidH family protein [Kitasatospora sp. NPDC058406]|uniref:YidH family protein n=1 Tax=Kitasatospora sp. NPDC058406 TaxID=3346483 RepID=UPI0036579C4D
MPQPEEPPVRPPHRPADRPADGGSADDLDDGPGDDLDDGPTPTGAAGGQAPDYRFTLANERTFLAWIRTALGLLAGGIAVDQLTPDVAPAPLRIALAVICALGGAALGAAAYRRWVKVEAAIRTGSPLPRTPTLLVLSVGVTLVAAVFCGLIIGYAD